MVEVVRKKVSYSFEEAIKKVEDALSTAGFALLLTKDLSEIFKKRLGIEDYPKYAFILACKPELAKMALDVSKDAGTLFPCSFVVYEDGDEVYVGHSSIMQIAAETKLAPADDMAAVIYETGKAIGNVWKHI